MKIKMGIVALIGLLMVVGLVFAGCDLEKCPGSGECTITIDQGANGLYVDTSAPRSSCGNTKDSDSSGGCQVANMNSIWYSETMRYGTHGCDC
jgi:hypothetical protein